MKKLTLMLTALALAASAPLAQSQPPSRNEASAVSSYSPPVEKHVKKPKKWKSKKGVPASSAMGTSTSSPVGASAGQ
ncbi:acid-shock protein [Paraburkholderia sp. IMGN_8]|uniref:acid-shock protein n=1 Tax=Paraburkholderia sp. IMGN_8 TaxID=3136564 RepID=UPI0031010D9E